MGGEVDVDGKRFRVVGTALFPATTNNYALADGVLFNDDERVPSTSSRPVTNRSTR